MKNRIMIAVFIMLLGLLLVLIPYVIFPVCEPPQNALSLTGHKMSPMKCFWTARAEMGIGIAVIVTGIFMLLSPSALIRVGLSLSLLCFALLSAAVPTLLIGVCSSDMMLCKIGTLPALLLVSAALFITALINVLYLRKVVR